MYVCHNVFARDMCSDTGLGSAVLSLQQSAHAATFFAQQHMGVASDCLQSSAVGLSCTRHMQQHISYINMHAPGVCNCMIPHSARKLSGYGPLFCCYTHKRGQRESFAGSGGFEVGLKVGQESEVG